MTATETLKKYFGFTEFRGKQKQIIESLLDRRQHALVLMPTGAGKSLCYQIPALMFGGGTVVISPLIALMQDQVDGLKKRNIPAEFINSTVPARQKKDRLEKFLNGEIKLLYVTPERFRKSEFASALINANISLIAVDEAHCISEWGHDFRPDYSRIAEFREMLGNPLTIALTATATPEVQNDIVSKLGLERESVRVYHQGIQRPNLRLEAEDVYGEEEKLNTIMRTLDSLPGAGIVYFALIKSLERFSDLLFSRGYENVVYHGKLHPKIRRRIQRDFLSGKSKLILATNAFGMGIDKPDIRFVIHAEIPSSIESYYQEIGRAGRDGKNSLCLMLYSQDDLQTQIEFIKWANPDADYYHRVFEILQNELTAVRAYGIEFIREKMSFKDKYDFRVETVLSMLDRYGVIEGSIQDSNIKVVSNLPNELADEIHIREKLMKDNKKLLSVVNYFKSQSCRRVYISDYFGFPGEQDCGNCDICN